MGMALLAAVAAGLNPYATLFLVAALATYLGFSLPGLGTPSPPVLIAVVAVAGLALPLNLVLGKLIRRRSRNPAPAPPPPSPTALGKARALARAHRRVTRVHIVGLAIWLLLAGGSSAFSRAGVSLLALALPVSLLAATGHSLLLLLHTTLARRARHRIAGPTVRRRLPLATLVRRVDMPVGALTGALVAVGLAGPGVSPLLAGVVGGGVALLTAALLTNCAERMRRDPYWRGLGHIPVLIAATTTAVIIIPLALIALGLGVALALLALALLGAGALGRRRLLLRASSPEPTPQSDTPVS